MTSDQLAALPNPSTSARLPKIAKSVAPSASSTNNVPLSARAKFSIVPNPSARLTRRPRTALRGPSNTSLVPAAAPIDRTLSRTAYFRVSVVEENGMRPCATDSGLVRDPPAAEFVQALVMLESQK